jgi:hypothetical protein
VGFLIKYQCLCRSNGTIQFSAHDCKHGHLMLHNLHSSQGARVMFITASSFASVFTSQKKSVDQRVFFEEIVECSFSGGGAAKQHQPSLRERKMAQARMRTQCRRQS